MITNNIYTKENFIQIYNQVKESMTNSEGVVNKRFYHSESVMKKALEINETLQLGLDENKIKIAAILHDSAKLVNKEELVNLLIEYNDVSHLDEIKNCIQVIHALAGKWYIQKYYHIFDEEIIDAVTYHCTGRSNMSTLEELIFVSDYAEDTREGEYFVKVRQALKYGLRQAVFTELEQVMDYFKKSNTFVYYLTIEAYNYYKEYKYK